MKCYYPMCPKAAPRDTLFRVNAKGQAGIWACSEHIKQTDAYATHAKGLALPTLDQSVPISTKGA